MNEENLFHDLPSSSEPEEPQEPQEPAKPAKPLTKEHESEQIANLERANREADSRLEQLRADLRAKRELEKKLKAGELPPEEVPAPTSPKAPEPEKEDVAAIVRRQLEEEKRKEYNKEIEAEVRKVAVNREEAETLYKQALELPSSGVASVDVRVALARVEELKKINRGFTAPSFQGSGMSDFTPSKPGRDLESLGYNADQISWFKKHNITEEQVRKYHRAVEDPEYMKRLFKGNNK